jgi:magnesium transporter
MRETSPAISVDIALPAAHDSTLQIASCTYAGHDMATEAAAPAARNPEAVVVRWISNSGAEAQAWPDVERLLSQPDGFVWIDLPSCDEVTADGLSKLFGFHGLAIRDLLDRSHLPKIHAYPDHLFVILHAPEAGEAGHVHLVELDQFIGRNYLVTSHGPIGEGVSVESATRETARVLGRIADGRLRPTTPFELSYAIVAAVAHRQGTYLSVLASKVATLEQSVRTDDERNPIGLLEDMFLIRHELLTLRTMGAQAREVYERMSALTRMIPSEAPPLIADLINRFERVTHLADGEMAFMQGVIDFYQARTSTRMNIAMERLALIAAVVLPVTAIASVYGMNLIVGQRTDVVQLVIVLALMALVAGAMLAWTKRMGWW